MKRMTSTTGQYQQMKQTSGWVLQRDKQSGSVPQNQEEMKKDEASFQQRPTKASTVLAVIQKVLKHERKRMTRFNGVEGYRLLELRPRRFEKRCTSSEDISRSRQPGRWQRMSKSLSMQEGTMVRRPSEAVL